MTTPTDLKPVRVSMMNAVHDLAVLVARDAGLFRDEGLDVEVVNTPGTAQVNADRMGGYRDGFSSVCGKIKNLKTENAFRIDMARTTFTDVLTTQLTTRYPQVKALVWFEKFDSGMDWPIETSKARSLTLPSATIVFRATALPLTTSSTGASRVVPMRARSMSQ